MLFSVRPLFLCDYSNPTASLYLFQSAHPAELTVLWPWQQLIKLTLNFGNKCTHFEPLNVAMGTDQSSRRLAFTFYSNWSNSEARPKTAL